jgi:predicted nucleotidyltransferase component of viral defense system
MVDLNLIRNFFPVQIRENSIFEKNMLKEYIQLSILDYLSVTPHIRRLTFIGGSNLRLVKGIDRFSEDLDFDCKELSPSEFLQMSDDVILFLKRSGYNVEAKDKESGKLTAYRRSIYFPHLLFDLGLSGHREERFLIKIEAQDQGVDYRPVTVNIKGCGFYFPFPVPPDPVLCAMKSTAVIDRGKGRDFYDLMFLLGQTKPDYDFLTGRKGIHNSGELKLALKERLKNIDLKLKAKDFEHMLFSRGNSDRILMFGEFIEDYL